MEAAEQFDELVAGISLSCDYGTGTECDNTVQWHFTYHNCNEELLCEQHAEQFLSLLFHMLDTHGEVTCTKCERLFDLMFDFLRVRRV